MFCCQRTSGMTDLTLFPRPGLLPICQNRSPVIADSLSGTQLPPEGKEKQSWRMRRERGWAHSPECEPRSGRGWDVPFDSGRQSQPGAPISAGWREEGGGHFSQLMGHQHTFIRLSWGVQVPGSHVHPLQKLCKYKLETSGLAFPSLGFGQGYNQWYLLASFNDL